MKEKFVDQVCDFFRTRKLKRTFVLYLGKNNHHVSF